jgi:ABC-type transport system involved in multi-copper enzyme maturation permease subunit
MTATIAWQMMSADFLKIRKRLGNVAFALLIAYGPLLIFFIVRAAQHASNGVKYPPAGGLDGFTDAVRLLAVFFGPIAAILIGSDAGAGDASAGVFRDLVVTGRSRVALFFSRVPAAIALSWLVMLGGYALLLIGTFAFAGGGPTPDGALIVNGLLFTLFSTGVICVVAVGFASLTASRPGALTTLIAWQLVASPIIASISSLGSSRDLLLSQAIVHYIPVHIGERGMEVTISGTTAALVTLGWMAIFLALGAWRTARMDT